MGKLSLWLSSTPSWCTGWVETRFTPYRLQDGMDVLVSFIFSLTLPVEQDARWDPEPVWTLWRRENSWALAENRTPVPQAEVGSTNRTCQLSTVNLNEIDWCGLSACRPRTSRWGKSIRGLRYRLRETKGYAATRMRVQLEPKVWALVSLSVNGRRCLEYLLQSSQRKDHITSHQCRKWLGIHLWPSALHRHSRWKLKFLILEGSS